MVFFQALLFRSRVIATVLQASSITPRMRRLTLGGPDVATWLDAAATGARVPAAAVIVTPAGRSGRGYTIRGVNESEKTIDMDFALHGDGADSGTVSDWARFAKPGDQVEISWPRGGFRLSPESRWVWLAADATALPAVQRVMESLPGEMEAYALLVVHDKEEEQAIHTSAKLHVEWAYSTRPKNDCGPEHRMPAKMPDIRLPGQALIAGEADWVKQWRSFWLNDQHLERRRVDAKGYWKEGTRGHRG